MKRNRLMYRFISHAKAERYIQRFGGKIFRDINEYTLLGEQFQAACSVCEGLIGDGGRQRLPVIFNGYKNSS